MQSPLRMSEVDAMRYDNDIFKIIEFLHVKPGPLPGFT
jgi:hypothetical protein